MNLAELRTCGRTPRVHGNGFLPLDLNEEGTRRLHVWSSRLPKQKVATPIHDHVFTLRSQVLCGLLIHEEIVALPAPEPSREHLHAQAATHSVWRAKQQPGTQNTELVRDGDGDVVLDVHQRLVLAPGSIYQFEAGRLHQTDSIGLTATVMEKIAAPPGYGSPRVLVPVGVEPDNEFHRDGFDDEFLWQIVGLVAPMIP